MTGAEWGQLAAGAVYGGVSKGVSYTQSSLCFTSSFALAEKIVDLAEYNRVKGFLDYSFFLPYNYAVLVYRALSAMILCTITDPTIYSWFGF